MNIVLCTTDIREIRHSSVHYHDTIFVCGDLGTAEETLL